ncbi:hypothetical protein GCM10011529_31130 [Polymorphobacter glacialis]|uniref:Uncharacterized protein n=1 Tax=Sandarakinorhabdus glacialis TaxID=1614636 RepID=A0A917A1M1_9SPHN|nr:hypothetical protein [Polymorphobacter glacialis]GGE22306.1 hypothetical protein GCM10011529_31130 [Polymorphobacter glacialis]
MAISTETYRYTIEPKKGALAEGKGVQTGVLRQSDGRWQMADRQLAQFLAQAQVSVAQADAPVDLLQLTIERWRDDPAATYKSWFLCDQRINSFRSIGRGIEQVVAKIEADCRGVAYRRSSLEAVVHSIAEQRQISKGAEHAFLWKPKLRISDIYENSENQRAFVRLLARCCGCNEKA